MRTHRNNNTEIPEQKKKKKHQLNHDRSDLRQPGKCVGHLPPVLLLS